MQRLAKSHTAATLASLVCQGAAIHVIREYDARTAAVAAYNKNTMTTPTSSHKEKNDSTFNTPQPKPIASSFFAPKSKPEASNFKMELFSKPQLKL